MVKYRAAAYFQSSLQRSVSLLFLFSHTAVSFSKTTSASFLISIICVFMAHLLCLHGETADKNWCIALLETCCITSQPLHLPFKLLWEFACHFSPMESVTCQLFGSTAGETWDWLITSVKQMLVLGPAQTVVYSV